MRTCSASRERDSTSYCSAATRVNTASVMAMNGTSYGTSKTGNAADWAASTMALGTRWKVNPVPIPSPEMSASIRRLR